MKKCVLQVETCDGCPHFDFQYMHYNAECGLLNRKILVDNEFNHTIPQDCPLPDWTEET